MVVVSNLVNGILIVLVYAYVGDELEVCSVSLSEVGPRPPPVCTVEVSACSLAYTSTC